MKDQVQHVLDTLRQRNGLYVASPSGTYHYVWIRDVCYIALSELHRDNQRYEQTYYSLLDIFRTYEWKLAYHAKRRPYETFEYIHPRYTADTFEEVQAPWGNAQNDAIGAFLYGIGAGLRRGKEMLRDDRDRRIVSLLIAYLITLEFWRDADNGMWEENREVHASSIGACVAGLLSLKPYFDVPWEPIQQGLGALFSLLPRESVTKTCDLALLSLVYPYRLVPTVMADVIVKNVEATLLRRQGTIRYVGDQYYQQENQEAEWCMGLPWLGLCHVELGDLARAADYLAKTETVMTPRCEIPELILGVRKEPNENTPLGWGHALWLVLNHKLGDRSER